MPQRKLALKLHRLGRVSFRSIKRNRDYLQHRKHASWMYMARLAATKEFAYNKALHDAGFRVPLALDHNRHCVLMEFVEALPLMHVRAGMLKQPLTVLEKLLKLIVRLAQAGIIHGDFNEFNPMIDVGESERKHGQITLIDFPQIVTTEHANAGYYFDRDVECVVRFFRKRFQVELEEWPTWERVKREVLGSGGIRNLMRSLMAPILRALALGRRALRRRVRCRTRRRKRRRGNGLAFGRLRRARISTVSRSGIAGARHDR